MDKSEFIVRVLLCHPTPQHEDTPEIKFAKDSIRKRYREIRRKIPFSTAEIISKKEWLDTQLRSN